MHSLGSPPWALRRKHRTLSTLRRRTDGYYDGEQMRVVVWERENSSFLVDRGISEEVKELRSRLRWVALLPPRAMVMPDPWLLPESMSGFKVLMQP